MNDRKQLIEEILASLNALKNKMHFKSLGHSGHWKITHSQWFVLCIIEANDHVGIKDISKLLGITASAATQLVDGLTANNYVKRKPGKHDKRALELEISSKGKKMMATAKKEYSAMMEILFKPLSTAELKNYLALHQKLLDN